MSTFTKYLTEKSNNKERICVYLNMMQKSIDRNGHVKENYMMLSGKIVSFDDESLVLSDQECLIRLDYVISIKPDRI